MSIIERFARLPNEPKPMNEHCRLEHSDWNYLERSEDELCPVCRGEQVATERIIKKLEEFIDNCDIPEVEDRLEWFKDSIKDRD